VRWLLNDIPTVLLGFVVVGVSIGLALALLTLVQRRKFDVIEDNGALEVVFAVIGAVYGILLAFVIVDLWTNFNAARDTVSSEASALAQVEIDTRALAQPDRARIDAAMSAYIHAVLNDEGQAMRTGRESMRAHDALDQLAFALEKSHLRPANAVQEAWYSEAVTKLNDVATARRQRTEAARRDVPMPFRLLIFVGSLVPIGFMTLVRVPHRGVKTLMVVVVAALVAYAVFLVLILDYPFSGTVSVSLEPFRQGVLSRLAP
jgi:hypothetical protein